jgi:hypothetical protein
MTTLLDEIMLGETINSSGHVADCGCKRCNSSEKNELETLFDEAFNQELNPVLTTPAPGAFYQVKRNDNLLTVVGRAYKVGAGEERLKLAQMVNNDPRNRKFWISPNSSFSRQHFKDGVISFSPRFTCGEEQRVAGRNDRKCYATIWIPRKSEKKVPEKNDCGIPSRDNEFIESELPRKKIQNSKKPAPKPYLSFYQETEKGKKGHFHCQAYRLAKKISAIQSTSAMASNSIKKIDATPYQTGRDIVVSIENAQKIIGEKIELIHFFGHGHRTRISGNFLVDGLYSSDDPERKKEYQDLPEGRKISSIPFEALSENVVVIIHNCSCAAGESNLAKELFNYLRKHLDKPSVFGHFNQGCAGRNNSWKEYSTYYPEGRILSKLKNYEEGGCCKKRTE